MPVDARVEPALLLKCYYDDRDWLAELGKPLANDCCHPDKTVYGAIPQRLAALSERPQECDGDQRHTDAGYPLCLRQECCQKVQNRHME
jgi:hypothetical protein